MERLIHAELDVAQKRSDFRILEIGSWAGQSTVVWAHACKDQGFGMVFCVDPWKVYESAPSEMREALRRNTVESLFWYNIRVSGVADYVVPIRTSTDVIRGVLKPNAFDFVYIDGDHGYTQFRRDLLACRDLVKVRGILCGDDLELTLDEVDEQATRELCERNSIQDLRSGRYYHPGITLAVHEILGGVSVKHGF